MAVPINDYSMSLAIDDRLVATARFSDSSTCWSTSPGRRPGRSRCTS